VFSICVLIFQSENLEWSEFRCDILFSRDENTVFGGVIEICPRAGSSRAW